MPMLPSIDFMIASSADEEGWVVAGVLEFRISEPGWHAGGGAGDVLNALRTVLAPDDELSGRRSGEDLEHLRVFRRGVKRRDLERHLREHGCRWQLRVGLVPPAPSLCRVRRILGWALRLPDASAIELG